MRTYGYYSVRGRPVRNPSTSLPALLQKKCSNQACFPDEGRRVVCYHPSLLFTNWGCFEHHIGRGLETKYDDTVRFNWLMWVWYNLPVLEIVCTFFTSNALRAWSSNLLSRNSPFVVTFHLPPWDAQTAWNSAVQVRSRWNFIMLGRNQRWWRRWVRLLKSRLLHNLLPENSGRKEEWMKCAHTKNTTRNKCRTCVGWQVSVSIDVSCCILFQLFFSRQYLLKSSGCPFPGNDEVE